MKKNIIENFKIIYLQNDVYYVSCKLGESIPKGIIVYYPLVSFIYETFVKDIFGYFLFFSIPKKCIYIYPPFLQVFLVFLVSLNKINGLASLFKPQLKTSKTVPHRHHISFRPLKFELKIDIAHLLNIDKKACAPHPKNLRKMLLFFHPPPKTRNNCQQWRESKKHDTSYKYKYERVLKNGIDK